MIDDLPDSNFPARVPSPPRTPTLHGFARTRVRHGFTVVEFRGEIDIAAVPAVKEQIDAATAPSGTRVIVDLRAATFLDASALALICRARRRALAQNGYMGLVSVCPRQRRILLATSLHTLFQPAASIEGACATALRRPHQ